MLDARDRWRRSLQDIYMRPIDGLTLTFALSPSSVARVVTTAYRFVTPQTSEVVTQDELFRYLMKFLRSVEQMVYKQVSGYDPSASDSAFDSGGPAEGLSEPGLFPVDMRNGRRPLPAAIISATIETLRDHAVQMELLEHAASR